MECPPDCRLCSDLLDPRLLAAASRPVIQIDGKPSRCSKSQNPQACVGKQRRQPPCNTQTWKPARCSASPIAQACADTVGAPGQPLSNHDPKQLSGWAQHQPPEDTHAPAGMVMHLRGWRPAALPPCPAALTLRWAPRPRRTCAPARWDIEMVSHRHVIFETQKRCRHAQPHQHSDGRHMPMTNLCACTVAHQVNQDGGGGVVLDTHGDAQAHNGCSGCDL